MKVFKRKDKNGNIKQSIIIPDQGRKFFYFNGDIEIFTYDKTDVKFVPDKYVMVQIIQTYKYRYDYIFVNYADKR